MTEPSENKKILDKMTPEHYIFRGFVRVCSVCGYGVLENLPTNEQITEFYNRQFWKLNLCNDRVAQATKGVHSPVHLARAKRQFEFIAHYQAIEGIQCCLEIGPGDALLSLELKKNASKNTVFDLCEPGESWLPYYAKKGLNKVADFFPFTSSLKYDLIVASHWLEHIPKVEAVFEALSGMLSDHGVVMIEIPNTAHDYWELPIKDTPHIHFFTLASLKRYAEQNRFKVLAIEEFGITMADYCAGQLPDYETLGPSAGGYSVAAILSKQH
ncbi:class I SAM-dependent methyltransferase [Arsukibacterium sp.]|uniref:class I SAM-dependent methyltransferase n=1 Tax=Arsukibacterium sp. TaxID=1977258 RepID=UPI002FD9657B